MRYSDDLLISLKMKSVLEYLCTVFDESNTNVISDGIGTLRWSVDKRSATYTSGSEFDISIIIQSPSITGVEQYECGSPVQEDFYENLYVRWNPDKEYVEIPTIWYLDTWHSDWSREELLEYPDFSSDTYFQVSLVSPVHCRIQLLRHVLQDVRYGFLFYSTDVIQLYDLFLKKKFIEEVQLPNEE